MTKLKERELDSIVLVLLSSSIILFLLYFYQNIYFDNLYILYIFTSILTFFKNIIKKDMLSLLIAPIFSFLMYLLAIYYQHIYIIINYIGNSFMIFVCIFYILISLFNSFKGETNV